MFGKKKKEEPEEEEEPPQQDNELSIGHIAADVEKLKAQFSTFYEVNKASTERFTRINEQIGELRTMILDRDKSSRVLEAKATQAIDMVETVQPDKLMVETRKQDAKIEALRATLESNEMIIKNALSELKDMRTKMQSFAGLEQTIKLSEDVKKELMEIRKTSATISRHGDKVETIFSEMQKRFSGFERFADNLKDIDKSTKDLASDLDSLKTRSTNFAEKKDIEDAMLKFNALEKHVSHALSTINKKIDDFQKEFTKKYNEKIEKIEKLLSGFETLAQKTPDLDKYFNLLLKESKYDAREVNVEKIKTPGEEEKPEEEEEKEKKPGLFSKLKNKFKSKEEKE